MIGSVVSVGSRVILQDDGVAERWWIVDPEEADAGRQRMSATSPLGRAILGRQVGERVRVDAPGGRRVVTILHID